LQVLHNKINIQQPLVKLPSVSHKQSIIVRSCIQALYLSMSRSTRQILKTTEILIIMNYSFSKMMKLSGNHQSSTRASWNKKHFAGKKICFTAKLLFSKKRM